MVQCPACKEPTVEGGRIANSKGKCYFKPDNSKLILMSYPRLDAFACKSCGNVAFVVDPETLKRSLK